MAARKLFILDVPFEKSLFHDQLKYVIDKFQIGLEITMLETADSIDSAKNKIESSQIILIRLPFIISYFSADIEAYLIDWIKDGGSAIVFIDPDVDPIQNRFLSNFGMTNTGIRLRPPYGYDVNFTRTAHNYRDRKLLKGVNLVILYQPNRIYLDGEKVDPILFNDDESYLAIDGHTDLLADIDSKELAPVAIWENDENKSRFFAISGTFLFDDESKLNIDENNDNGIFLKNMLNYLLDKPGKTEIAYTLFFDLEEGLYNFVDKVLSSKQGIQWYESLPPDMIEQMSRNTNRSDSIKNGLFFISLKKIIKINWEAFEPIFKSIGRESKKTALNWMDKVNEIRKYIAHPIKSIDSENPITRESIDLLSDNLELVNKLIEKLNSKAI